MDGKLASCPQISSVVYQVTVTLLSCRNDMFRSGKLILFVVCAEVCLFTESIVYSEWQVTK